MRRKLAFTFIEIMVAITVFSVGILVVMRLITDNLDAMDKNNIRLQATLLAKEGIELVYNIRDANLRKQLSWNCLMNKDMYTWTTEDLSKKIWRLGQLDFEKTICDWYFGEDNNLQVWFDIINYVYYNLSDKTNSFYDNYKNNKLYMYTKNMSWYKLSWYGYKSDKDGIYGDIEIRDTVFARYISFSKVREGDYYLPSDKILKVESHVLYMRWWNTGEVVFESFIWNY